MDDSTQVIEQAEVAAGVVTASPTVPAVPPIPDVPDTELATRAELTRLFRDKLVLERKIHWLLMHVANGQHQWKCEGCQYAWYGRSIKFPTYCPNCRSIRWMEPDAGAAGPKPAGIARGTAERARKEAERVKRTERKRKREAVMSETTTWVAPTPEGFEVTGHTVAAPPLPPPPASSLAAELRRRASEPLPDPDAEPDYGEPLEPAEPPAEPAEPADE